VGDPYEFDAACTSWVEQHRIEEGLPPKEAQQAATMSPQDLFDVFLAHIVAEVDRPFAHAGTVALPGQLYLRDRRREHGLAAVYCRSRKGHDRPLVRVRLRKTSGALEIRLPVLATVAAEIGLGAKVLHGSGRYKSEVVLFEKDALASAKKIARLVELDKIQLPAKGMP
jgi:hypothetical protein